MAEHSAVSQRAARREWADFTWPDWVPLEERRLIEKNWSPSYPGDRSFGPDAWIENAKNNRCYRPLGAEIFAYKMFARHPRRATDVVFGRWLFRWSNIGTVVLGSGAVEMVSSEEVEPRHLEQATALEHEGLGHG